jgi:hypothetical protein
MTNRNISLKKYLQTLPPAQQSAAKSQLLNIFHLNPWLSRLYGAYFLSTGCNPFEIRNMQPRSEFFFDLNLANRKGNHSMAANQTPRICTHIKPSGHRCGSPALRGEVFCYFHQRLIRGVHTPPKSRLHPIAILDDAKAIQVSLMEIINALVRNTIDYRRAQLILRALHMAAKNVRRATFDTRITSMVEEVPEYPAPPEARRETRPEASLETCPETKNRKPLANAQTLPPEQVNDEASEEPAWDWDEIRKKIEANTCYEPPRKTPIAPAPLGPAKRTPPASAKLPPQSNGAFGELASKLLAELSPS